MSTRRLPLAAEEPSRPVASALPLGAGVSTKEGDLLQVGDLAKATGKTVRAIHLYEELGLLRAHERSKGRYRLFTSDALLRVRWISKLQNLGLSLAEIQELVREQDGSGSATVAAQKLKEAYVQRLSETRRKIEELRELEAELKDSLAYLTACDSACESQVPVHSCPSCERHPEREHAPELVTAVHVV
jgi:MerR family copper efflux transcriptional regulator